MTRAWKALPVALWTYFVALILYVVVAISFSAPTFPLNLLTASTAFGLFVIQTGAYDFCRSLAWGPLFSSK